MSISNRRDHRQAVFNVRKDETPFLRTQGNPYMKISEYVTPRTFDRVDVSISYGCFKGIHLHKKEQVRMQLMQVQTLHGVSQEAI